MSLRATTGVVIGVAVFAFLVAATVVFAQLIPQVALVSSEPEPPSEEVTFAVERRVDLSAPTNLELDWSEPRSLRPPPGLEGFITELVEPARASCGEVVAHVNAQPLVALCSPFPLWRDLNSGSQGVDAEVLTTMLGELGYLKDGDNNRSAVRRAIRTWQSEIGVTVDGVVQPSMFLWFGAEISPFDWSVDVGDPISTGSDLASSTPRIVSGRVSIPTASVSGDWLFELANGSRPIPVQNDGSVGLDASNIEDVLPEAALSDQASELGGRVFLSEPFLTAAVTATALVGDSTGGWCVIRLARSTGEPEVANVQIVDSRLGSVFLQGQIQPGDLIVAMPTEQAC